MRVASYNDSQINTKTSFAPGAQNLACGGLDNLNALFAELKNPMSLWQDLRITVMSGADYVFIPQYVYDAFSGTYPANRFIAELACAFNLDITRLQILAFSEELTPSHFSRAVIEWRDGGIGHCHTEAVLAQSSYNDFAKSLFQHSMPLLEPTEH